MATQRTLFDNEPTGVNQYGYPLSRSSDPATSKRAAEEVAPKLGHLCQVFVDCLVALGQASTAREVAEHARRIGMCREVESVRKRSKELVSDGHIVVAGERECSETGKLATVYWVK